MNLRDCQSADRARRSIEDRQHDRLRFREALLSVPAIARDAWVDRVLGLEGLPEDGPELPNGCVPYLPCSVDALIQVVDHVPVRTSDVFVDVGSGVGRAGALVHLLTGASVIGIEIQSQLVRSGRDLASRLSGSGISYLEGDATHVAKHITIGTVFFLYCPFSGDRLGRLLADLESIAQTRQIRICSVDLPLPPYPWLALEHRLSNAQDVAIYRSTLEGA
jgi:SAM-dependent methyltransferase